MITSTKHQPKSLEYLLQLALKCHMAPHMHGICTHDQTLAEMRLICALCG